MSSAVATASLLPEPAPRRHAEDDLQRACCAFLEWALPPDAVFYAVPNGGKRHKREAARMAGLGLRAGVPDLAIVHRGRALFVELKSGRGVMSPAQRSMAQRLNYAGAAVCCCRSVEEVEAALREACVPLRGSVAA
jgi:hypothetical protein